MTNFEGCRHSPDRSRCPMSVPHLELKATMARVRSCWGRSHTVALIWLISATTFVSVFEMALRNSSSTYPSSDNPVLNKERRSRLYDRMTKDLEEHGAAFLKLGETSQSLSISELFTLKDGYVTPNHKAAIPPVRANVLYLNPEYSNPISKAVRSTFLPHFDPKIWFQNSSLYHFSMFHASHHIAPVPATEEEIEAEATAVKAVAESLCPLKLSLDRVVLTSTGVLLGCWQVISGTDPITIRAKLKSVLPRAPEKQLYDVAILHTSFARLLGHPSTLPGDVDKILDLQFFNGLVRELNDKIRGFQATVTELWYVEEFDVLALAVDGNMKVRKFQLGCSKA